MYVHIYTYINFDVYLCIYIASSLKTLTFIKFCGVQVCVNPQTDQWIKTFILHTSNKFIIHT